jgi:uncharacterized protein YjiS (DUF1127 family)
MQELKMSILAHETMTNHHVADAFRQIGATLRLWRERARSRQELARWTARDLHDIGVSAIDVAHEIEKPFWRG